MVKLVKLNDVACEPVAHEPGIMKQVLLSEDELPASVRLSHATLKPGQKVKAHRHEALVEVFYLLSGTACFRVDGHAFMAQKGSVVRIDAGEEHSLVNSGSEDLHLLYFGLKSE